MTQQYLDKFKGIIGQRQTEQVIKLLNTKRNTGQIRTVEEFSQQLESLMRELTSTILQPSLKLWMAEEEEIIDSDTFNFMLDRIQDDLEAAFEESLKIDEVQRSHEAIVRDVVLKNLRAGVAELESKITLYELINKGSDGFDAAIFSTFRESREEKTQRGGPQTSVLFADPRTKLLIPATQNAAIELVGERLTLANKIQKVHDIARARQIFDSTTAQSELIVEPPGLSIQNIIDNTTGTYWVQSLLFQNQKENVKTKIELDLGATKSINFVEIEAAVRYPIVLEAIHYLDGNKIVTDLGIPETTITSNLNIRVKKVATNRLILTFRNENPSKIQFEYDATHDTLFGQALIEPPEGITPSIDNVAPELNEIIRSSKIKNLIEVQLKDKDIFYGYEYLMGFDNIRVGITTYEDTSIYVSTPLKTSANGQLGLKTLERRPYNTVADSTIRFSETTYDADEDNIFLGSIEYWIIKQDLTPIGGLKRTSIFPILPLGKARINHERLLLTEKSTSTLTRPDTGKLNFFTNRTDGNFKIYRNGVEMTSEDQTDSLLATTGWRVVDATDTDRRTPNNGEPMQIKIQILDPLAGDIFTVSYTPLISSTKSIPKNISTLLFDSVTGLKVVDLVGDLSARLTDGQIVVLDQIGDITTTESNIYLAIILRQNTAETSLTPVVEEYTLLAGSKDLTKFEET